MDKYPQEATEEVASRSVSEGLIDSAEQLTNRLQQVRIELIHIEERLFGETPRNIASEDSKPAPDSTSFVEQLNRRTSNQNDLINDIQDTLSHLSQF